MISPKEEGFTLVEIMIVIVIIGILAAAGVLIWQNQEKQAIYASVKSDLKNAATAMQTYATKNSGYFPQYLPNDYHFTEGDVITIDRNYSNSVVYCLVGYNTSDTSKKFYYSNYGGGLLKESATSCPDLSSFSTTTTTVQTSSGSVTAPVINGVIGSWSLIHQADLLNAKALVVGDGTNVTGIPNGLSTYLTTYGFLQVEFATVAVLSSYNTAELNTYSLMVYIGKVWGNTLPSQIYSFYESGGKVLVDGNDYGQSYFVTTHIAWTATDTATVGGVGFIPTQNTGLSPAFPYNFSNSFWSNGNDSEQCITALTNGAIALANWPHNSTDGIVCITLFGASNPVGGRFLKYQEFDYSGTNAWNTPVMTSGLDWLTS